MRNIPQYLLCSLLAQSLESSMQVAPMLFCKLLAQYVGVILASVNYQTMIPREIMLAHHMFLGLCLQGMH